MSNRGDRFNVITKTQNRPAWLSSRPAPRHRIAAVVVAVGATLALTAWQAHSGPHQPAPRPIYHDGGVTGTVVDEYSHKCPSPCPPDLPVEQWTLDPTLTVRDRSGVDHEVKVPLSVYYQCGTPGYAYPACRRSWETYQP
jgi:hypothetical protein